MKLNKNINNIIKLEILVLLLLLLFCKNEKLLDY